jgi:hypothetical protein
MVLNNDRIFGRVGHIEMDVGGSVRSFYDLDFRFNIEKVAGGGTPNFAQIGILGLSRTTVNDIATYLNVGKQASRRKVIKVYAGYQDTGEQLIFCGDIIIAKPSQPTENWINISAQTNAWMRSEVVSLDVQLTEEEKKEGKKLTVQRVFENIARLYGMSLEYRTANYRELERVITGFDCTGSYQDIFRRANTLSSVRMRCDNTAEGRQIIIVYDMNPAEITGSSLFNLSANTGLIGIPEFMQPSVKFRMLMNPYVHLFDDVNISSILVPNAGGIYRIYQMRYNGQLRGTNWYMDCVGRLLDYEDIAKKSGEK